MQLATDIMIAGSVGGIAKLIMAPTDRVKILLQTQSSNPTVLSGLVVPYKGAWDCLVRVIQEQGVISLYRGILINILRYIPQQGAALILNDAINNLFPRYDPKTDFWKAFSVKLLSGALADIAAIIVCAPFDLARTRLASDMVPGRADFSGSLELWSAVFLQHGLSGFLTGMSSVAIGSLTYRFGQLVCFKQIQDANPYRREPGLFGAISSFVAVTLARSVVLPLTYPFDTVRRHMFLEAELPHDSKEYHGSVECFFKIINRDGISGLFQGLVFEFLQGFGGSLVIVGYDVLKKYFNR